MLQISLYRIYFIIEKKRILHERIGKFRGNIFIKEKANFENQRKYRRCNEIGG